MGDERKKEPKDLNQRMTASQIEAKRTGIANRQISRTSAIKEVNRREANKTSGIGMLGSFSRTKMIEALRSGGTAVRDESGMVVGVVSGDRVKTYTGRSNFNPFGKTKGSRFDAESGSYVSNRQGYTDTGTKDAEMIGGQPIQSSSDSMPSPDNSVAVRKRLMRSTSGNEALRRRYLG
tara:strand:+ start:2428 stop:2961 length:534 start_codon:yes stop_codon:yes gene_type:complete